MTRIQILRLVLHIFGTVIPACLIAALVVIVLADVIARNFLAMSILWAHEFAVILLSATVWFGLTGAAMSGQMFGISLFVDRLPPRAGQLARMIADLLVMLIAAAVIHAAWAQISTARFTKFLSLGWPKWIVAVLLAAGMALIILTRIIQLAGRVRGNQK
ncbi:TRAP transporter small permease subunit [Pseudotabrizicola alkalilacus]|uniref:TRAP transporter small permease protein n=1 Tax=Pseudotabrizicola alkalilacus TaxID=2305252 RepID=A0A411YX15_9RHOB|nr:TRAP transporter small permease subunit [Pseudotabrizicola alkalilacus]